MFALLNQYSFVAATLVIGLLLAFGLWRWRRGPRLVRIGLLVVYVIGALGIAAASRYPDPQVTSVAEADTVLNSGQPVFVMLYSNY
jgi:hypothetical protein